MKKIFVIILVLFGWSADAIAQERLSDTLFVSFFGSKITVRSTAVDNATPQFTPGNHGIDTSVFLIQMSPGIYSGNLLDFQRGFGSGFIGDQNIIIYHLSSGIVPADMSKPVVVQVVVPTGKHLIYHGQIWREGIAEVAFSDYFVAREFPLELVDQDKYIVRWSKFNRVDSLMAVYCWVDSLGKSKLEEAFAAVDSGAAYVGGLIPDFWHRFIINYDGVGYVLTYIINNKVVTGLEHFNAPYSITVPSYIRADGVCHTLFHSVFGKALMPKEYLSLDGKYHESDAMFLYEGLVTFLSLRYADNFSVSLAAMIYRAKLSPVNNNLRNIGRDHQFESYYAKGYLNWVDWQSKGLNIDLLVKYLCSIKLILSEKVPIAIDYDLVIKWIADYNRMLGLHSDYLSLDNLNGGYLQSAFKSLEDKGLELIPTNKIAQWDTAYVGPYPIKGIGPRQPMLPIDGYPILPPGARPVYLIDGQAKKIEINPGKDNEALRLLFQFPDSLFMVGFSDGSVIGLKKNLYFSDGTRHFMYSQLDSAKYYENQGYWDRLNVKLKKEKQTKK